MASYSYSGNYDMEKSGPTYKTLKCKKCGWMTPYRGNGDTPKICSKCQHNPTTGESLGPEMFHNEHAAKGVKLTTHRQIGWKCPSCGHYGITWRKKKGGSPLECPNCGKRVMTNGIPDRGRSKNLWPPANPDRPKVKNNVYHCGNCGHLMTFRLVRPKRCSNCGQELNS